MCTIMCQLMMEREQYFVNHYEWVNHSWVLYFCCTQNEVSNSSNRSDKLALSFYAAWESIFPYILTHSFGYIAIPICYAPTHLQCMYVRNLFFLDFWFFEKICTSKNFWFFEKICTSENLYDMQQGCYNKLTLHGWPPSFFIGFDCMLECQVCSRSL